MRQTDARDEGAGAKLAPAADSLRRSLERFFRRKLRGSHEVDDLVQDVFLRIISRNSTDPITHLGAYVLRTALTVLTDRSRRRASHCVDEHVELDPDQDIGLDFDPERIMASKQDLAEVAAALLELPERTRSVFLLFRMEEMSQREIAARLGITVSGVQKHILKAMRHLRARRRDER